MAATRVSMSPAASLPLESPDPSRPVTKSQMLRLVRDVKEKKREAAKDPMRMFRCLRVEEGQSVPPLLRVDRLPPEIRQLTREMLRHHLGVMEQYGSTFSSLGLVFWLDFGPPLTRLVHVTRFSRHTHSGSIVFGKFVGLTFKPKLSLAESTFRFI